MQARANHRHRMREVERLAVRKGIIPELTEKIPEPTPEEKAAMRLARWERVCAKRRQFRCTAKQIQRASCSIIGGYDPGQVNRDVLPSCEAAAWDVIRKMRSLQQLTHTSERLRYDIRHHPAYWPEYGDGGVGDASAPGATTPRGLETERVNLQARIRGSLTAAHVWDADLRDLYRRLAQIELATLTVKLNIARDEEAAEASGLARPKRRPRKNRQRPEPQELPGQEPPLPPPGEDPSAPAAASTL